MLLFTCHSGAYIYTYLYIDITIVETIHGSTEIVVQPGILTLATESLSSVIRSYGPVICIPGFHWISLYFIGFPSFLLCLREPFVLPLRASLEKQRPKLACAIQRE